MATLGEEAIVEEPGARDEALARDETLAGDDGPDASELADEETLAGDEPPEPERPRPGRLAALLQRGASIGRYVVLERLGRGGMGVVLVAYDPELDRRVAVKVLVPRGSDEADAAARQRLHREAQAMARVSHPNVVAVHDVGVHEGRVFVAMELVEGTTLARWLAVAPRPVPAIVALFVQAGRGLAAAHAKGLVHRDFKPDNVMVREGDAGLRAQVMDFGLVRALGDAEVETPADTPDGEDRSSAALRNRLTRFGQVLGTPSFMAPEQYEAGPIDARADQFSFCVALWEAAFGVHPFGATDPAELAMNVTSGHRPEPPPSARAHPRLRAALDRGLAVDPTQRWPSMIELLAELERDPSRRRRRMLVAAAGVAAVGLVVGGERLWHARQVAACERDGERIDAAWGADARARVREGMLATGLPRAEESHARLSSWLDRHAEAWREARTRACLAAEVEATWAPERLAAAVDCLDESRGDLEAFVDVLARADREVVDHAVTRAAELPPPRLCVDERYLAHQAAPPSTPEARAEHDALRAELAQVGAAHATRRFSEARTRLEAIEPRVEALGPSSLRVRALALAAALDDAEARFSAAEAGHREAFALALELGAVSLAGGSAVQLSTLVGGRLGRTAEGLWWADVAAGLYRRLGEPDDGMRMASVLRQRAALHQRQGEFREALALAERALAIDEASLGADHPSLGWDLEQLALIQIDLGDLHAAETLARQSVDRLESSLGAANPVVASPRHTLGEALRHLGRSDDALAEHRRALAVREAALPPDHPDVARSLGQVGLALQHLGRSDEALPRLERAVAILEGSLGHDHVDLPRLLSNLGNVRQSLGRFDEALAAYERALAITDARLGPEHPTKGVLLANVATTEVLLERHVEAAEHLEQALRFIEAAHGPEHPNVAIVLINLADVRRQLGQLDRAQAANTRALAILEAAFDPRHPDVAYPLLGLAMTEIDRGRHEAALPLAERALLIRESQPVSPVELATARHTVAQALAATGQDLPRAKRLAEQALEGYEGLPGPGADRVRYVLEVLAKEGY